MKLSEWTNIVKIGRLKKLAPYDTDWYYIRAASVERKIYLRGSINVDGFGSIYGHNQRNEGRSILCFIHIQPYFIHSSLLF
ncbi:hypothetical protein KY284_036747 [Solanum tuberosum]|nr:hypothetical protein KY284_036747 [Solanum tuberosum]